MIGISEKRGKAISLLLYCVALSGGFLLYLLYGTGCYAGMLDRRHRNLAAVWRAL